MRGLVVIDDVPADARRVGVPTRTDGAAIVVDGWTLGLGDLAGGDVVEVRYEIETDGGPLPRTLPRILWELRP